MKKHKAEGRSVTPYEREVLTILLEECAEVIQAVTKMLRFGPDDYYPDTKVTKTKQLGLELGDLQHMTTMAKDLGLIRQEDMTAGFRTKGERLRTYMQTRPS